MSAKRCLFTAFPTRESSLAGRFLLVAVALALAWGSGPLLAQQPADDSGPKLPPEEAVELVTSDGLTLKASYYPGPKEEKSIPVVLLHELRGRHDRDSGNAVNTRFSRDDYRTLAEYLHRQGFAVFVPDLRGHGKSNTISQPGRPSEVIDPEDMGPRDYQRIVSIDLPAIKEFLIEKNNEKELDIERLAVVAAEESAVLAVFWAQIDWSIPPSGRVKQGQDIKALILLSPQWSVPGLQWGQVSRYQPMRLLYGQIDEKLRNALGDPNSIDPRRPIEFDFRKEVPVRILVGWHESGDPSDKPPPHVREAMSDARRVYSLFKMHQDVLLGKFDTKAQGTTLLQVPGIKAAPVIARIIASTAGSRQADWDERIDPYAGR